MLLLKKLLLKSVTSEEYYFRKRQQDNWNVSRMSVGFQLIWWLTGTKHSIPEGHSYRKVQLFISGIKMMKHVMTFDGLYPARLRLGMVEVVVRHIIDYVPKCKSGLKRPDIMPEE